MLSKFFEAKFYGMKIKAILSKIIQFLIFKDEILFFRIKFNLKVLENMKNNFIINKYILAVI